MTIVNAQTGTRIDEIAPRIFRISTPVPASPELPRGFSFNQFLIAADEPLLFHAGPRRMFPLVREAVRAVLAPESLRYVGFSHVEADESGALEEWLSIAPGAKPVCSQVGAMIFARDVTDREVVALAHGQNLELGSHRVAWFDAPHVPHGWECGFLGEVSTRTLFCGDLFTQAGDKNPPITESDILAPSEAMRAHMDYFSRGKDTRLHLERMASFEPRVLACMHGSAYAGDGRAALHGLAAALEA